MEGLFEGEAYRPYRLRYNSVVRSIFLSEVSDWFTQLLGAKKRLASCNCTKNSCNRSPFF
ncbi:MAG: hypothetical protein LBH59_07620 [Planctomycetaceae bacterium]|nr:hypothetical protein [Planctomycetaceae bacterium]